MDKTLSAQAYRLDCLAEKILAGNLSAAMDKRAENWTLPELKAIAAELSAHGDESNIYAKAKEAMDSRVCWTASLANNKPLSFRIIGIAHDELEDGSGKAGLTFEAVNDVFPHRPIQVTGHCCAHCGELSINRDLDSDYFYGIIPDELKMFIEPVKKSTCYRAVDRKNREVEKRTVTVGKLFILSESEIYGSDDGSDFDGTQYGYYRDKGTTSAYFFPACEDFQRWTRSSVNSTECCYSYVDADGSCHIGFADDEKAICPAFCF